MQLRKVIGWILFGLGIPIFFVGAAVSKELFGTMTWGILVGLLITGGGWILAHPKKK